MKVKRLVALGLAGALACVAGCNGWGLIVRLDADDNGSTLSIPVGGRIVVSLASNPTTGYDWELMELDAAVVESTDVSYVPDPAPPGWVGGGGTAVWQFTALAEGETALRLEYGRDFEPEEDPADVFETTITVTAAE